MLPLRTYYQFGSRIFSFSLLPAISALVPLIAIPVITGNFGGDVWVSVAIGISVGSAGSVVVELGWGLNGSIRIARASLRSRASILGLALVTKSMVLGLVLIPVVGLCFALGVENVRLASVIAVAYLLTGLSSSWYFIGTASPLSILICEVSPRVILVLVSCVGMQFFDLPVEVYGGALILASIVGIILVYTRVGLTRSDIFGHSRIRIFLALRQQRQALMARSASAIYIALPVTLVGFVSPASLLVFSSAERILRMVLSLLQSVPNSFQSYVGSARNRENVKSRVINSLSSNIVIGFIAALLFGLFCPLAVEFLFSGLVDLPSLCVLLSMGIVFCTCSSRAVGSLGLVAFRDLRAISVSAMLGAVVGVTSILAGAWLWGAEGALAGMLLSELVVLGYQSIALRRYLRRPRRVGLHRAKGVR